MSSTKISKSTDMKESRKVSPYDDRDKIEDTLLRSYISEKEILITYYKDSYFPTSYMTVIELNPLKRSLVCIDAFDRKHTFSVIDIIDAR
ncbi:YolD-like family protein [Bacillus mobilis]|uniref:YolD-like family protein n=2 Tax=Bacillus cereus group TaxID=86661 RepID=A0A1C4F7T8_BACCE|nr:MULTISPECIES: YolD-like family protein [Bacillus cereus group]MCC2459813.1 YolD-like family protein [Bacillus mobilis]MCU5432066.1 YolD-like family protein [Bacillus mobilis]MCU5591960.1 YolD-like family protein [Bacillus mobilis]MCU5735868.1 YolD-like family protein [Bacillus mobilis]MCU9559907.1 YolD-like family protein [Bacillus mobilis]